MSDYQDNYESAEKSLMLQLDTAKWSLNQTEKLLNQYKKCRTENCKRKIEKTLRSMWDRMNYENKQLTEIIRKANDEGI